MSIYIILLMAYSVICPFLAIGFFILGYNASDSTGKLKVLPKKKHKSEKSAEELMLERIDNAEVYRNRKKDN